MLKKLTVSLFVLFFCYGAANAAVEKEDAVMDRPGIAQKERMRWMGGDADKLAATDPEFAAITGNLLYGEILNGGGLTDLQKSLVILASLTATQAWDELPDMLKGALRVGVTPLQIREALYQCAPYTGFPRVRKALELANAEFQAAGISLPLANAGTVTEATRFRDGLAAQKKIFGTETIENMQKNAPADQQNLVTNFLSAWCFGDFYTREVLDLKLRELVTFSAIVSLGGCEPQARAHAQANLAVGNTGKNLVDALSTMLPYIGFPRTLNGLACVNAVLPKENK